MDEHRLALQRLDQVRSDGVLHQHRHGAGDPEVVRRDGDAAAGLGDHDPAQPRAKVPKVRSQAQQGHHLRRRCYHEPGFAGHAMSRSAQPDDDLSERAVVDVQRSGPRDRARFDVEGVVVVDGSVQRGREQVVRRRHGVEIAVEMEVDVLHGQDLGVAAAGAAALDAEHRAHGGFAHAQEPALPDLREALDEAYRAGGLPFSCLGGSG